MVTMPDISIAIYTLTRHGLRLAKRLATALGATIYASHRHVDEKGIHGFTSLPELINTTFSRYDGHIFITAAGIAVRCIGPLLKSKDVDPAVVCMDQEGQFAVSLLSGHLGGANELAVRCAECVGGHPVITTATDSTGVPSMDMLAQARGLVIGNIDRIKTINGSLLDTTQVQLFDPDDTLGLADNPRFTPVESPEDWKPERPGVWVSFRTDCPDDAALRLYPRVLMLGVGCRRGVAEEEITRHIHAVFDAAGLALQSVGGLASVTAKADELGLLQAAERLNVTPEFFEKSHLETIDTPNPSGTVLRRMGVESVSEAAAIILSDNGKLLVEKTKTKTVTLAVARRRPC